MVEIWKPIANYQNSYEISNLGHVRSLTRLVGGLGYQRLVKGGDRAVVAGVSGKLIATLCNGESRTFSVDRLVAEAFVPNPHNFRHIRHLDGDQLNCTAENLAWIKSRAQPPKPRNIKGVARNCPNCGKRSFYVQNLTKTYLCCHCHYRGQLAPRANTKRMVGVRSDYAAGGWTYEALAKKYQIAPSTAWNWINEQTTNPAELNQP